MFHAGESFEAVTALFQKVRGIRLSKECVRTAEGLCWGLYERVLAEQQQGGREGGCCLLCMCSAHSWAIASLAAVSTRVPQLYSASLAVEAELLLDLQDNFDYAGCVLGILFIYKYKIYGVFFNT